MIPNHNQVPKFYPHPSMLSFHMSTQASLPRQLQDSVQPYSLETRSIDAVVVIEDDALGYIRMLASRRRDADSSNGDVEHGNAV